MEEDKLKVRKIESGTVIDHIPAGRALTVLKILGISEGTDATVSLLMNVPSKKYGKKDIVKVEGRKVDEKEVDKIALTAPEATINEIRNFEVEKKRDVELPDKVEGIVSCSTPSCITNSGEPVSPTFDVVERSPLKLRCRYCKRITRGKEVLEQLRG
ncbi:aspartate carbamoyltransferase [candidate division MSBL1 archaeon SCGC-AAA259B11]|uniref:Aspartate carbamoyltransferase regulatory chain n=1 Tax=candidate division MSBL1 archaeon SCGC-AAA259B11 TaxID=1698260 RepID=A0A133U5G4_9EURY|nr:aspartate carbamoyltransferase [candidate division MSBL1 archaeon SCGC-AAA259B11]